MKIHKVFWQLLWISWEHFSGPKRLLKTQIFEEKAIFPVEKRFWPTFSRIIEHDLRQKTFFQIGKLFWLILLYLLEHFFRSWEVVENTLFEEKGKLSSEKKTFDQF